MSSYRDFLLHHLHSDRFQGNKAKMAKAFGMTPKHLSRGLEGTTTFSLERNLFIAKVLQEDAAFVLTLANLSTMNHLIQDLYGRPKLSSSTEHLLEALKHCSAAFRHELIDVVAWWAELGKRRRGHE